MDFAFAFAEGHLVFGERCIGFLVTPDCELAAFVQVALSG